MAELIEIKEEELFIPSSIKIGNSHDGKGLFSRKAISKGEKVFKFIGEVLSASEASGKSLQIGEDQFLESTVKFDDYLNHSCNPNCHIDWRSLNLVASRNIKEGEELTFDYNTSEYDLLDMGNFTFNCNCQAENCLREIRGFKYLSPEEKTRIKKFISPFLKINEKS